MSFKSALLACVMALGLSGCGDYSNEDLEFIAVLPSNDEVQSNLPGTYTRGAGLVSGLAKLYQDTREGTAAFNRAAYQTVALIDFIRELPFTSKESNTRTWGPWPDSNQPGFSVRAVMERLDDTRFTCNIEYKRTQDPNTEWFAVLETNLSLAADLRTGRGDMHLMIQAARDGGLAVVPTLGNATQIDLTYVRDSWPISISMSVKAGELETTYSYREHEEGHGVIRFSFPANFIGGLLSPIETWTLESRWLVTGEGRGSAAISSPEVPLGTRQDECWNSSFEETYLHQSWWNLTLGNEQGDCSQELLDL